MTLKCRLPLLGEIAIEFVLVFILTQTKSFCLNYIFPFSEGSFSFEKDVKMTGLESILHFVHISAKPGNSGREMSNPSLHFRNRLLFYLDSPNCTMAPKTEYSSEEEPFMYKDTEESNLERDWPNEFRHSRSPLHWVLVFLPWFLLVLLGSWDFIQYQRYKTSSNINPSQLIYSEVS